MMVVDYVAPLTVIHLHPFMHSSLHRIIRYAMENISVNKSIYLIYENDMILLP